MNLKKLKEAEEAFFNRYPGGFENPEMVEIGKKHKMDKMIAFAQEGFVRRNFKLPDLIVDNDKNRKPFLYGVFVRETQIQRLCKFTPREKQATTRQWNGRNIAWKRATGI